MRRRHNIALATIACLGTIYLVAQHRQGFQHAYGRYGTHTSYDAVESKTGIEVLPSDLNPSSSSDASPQRKPKEHVTSNDDSPAQGASENSASTPPPSEVQPPSSNHQDQTVLEAEYSFQKDLDLLLPLSVLQRFSDYKPHNYVADSSTPKYAYATFLATRNPSLKDPYFLAIHSLIHRLLWSPKSRTQKHPFIVFVADFVTPEQRALLSGAGALVRELAPLPWTPNVAGVQARWKDLFAKLNMWRETEFSRLLFLDADAFPLQNMDAMFDLPPLSQCVPENLHLDDFLADGPVCEPYVFAGIPQDPFSAENPNINVGAMVFSPSQRMHARLLQNYPKTDKYDCLMAEQAFLNWQFGPRTAFPATRLDRMWGGFFPQENEQAKLKVVHEKIWVADKGWMKEEWEQGWRDMITFYESPEFVQEREKDGKVDKV